MEQIKSEELYLELKREKEVLEKIVNVINLFVEKYKDAKEVFSQFNLDYIDFSVENIKKIIDELENKVNHYNEVVEPEYKKLNDNMQVLYDKFTEILEKQENLNNFLNEIDELVITFKSINFNFLTERLEGTISSTINLCKKMESNLKELDELKKEMNELKENTLKQNGSLEELIIENRETNKLLIEISKNNNIDTAILFELMDEWQNSKKSNKR